MKIYICKVCGHVEFNQAPAKCPTCGASQASFSQNDNVFAESAAKSKEAAVKHVPSVKIVKQCGLIPDKGCIDVIVRIGETLHPMEDAHFIQFVDCYIDDIYVSRVLLSPGVYAAACFHLKAHGENVTVVENCNIHGYWMVRAGL